MQVPSFLTSGLANVMKAFGMPAPVAEVTMNLVPKMMEGNISTPQIIASIMSFAINQAKGAVATKSREKYPQLKGFWWLGLFEEQGAVYSVPMLQSKVANQKGIMSTNEGIFIDGEAQTELLPFVTTELKKLSGTISIKDLQEKYAPVLDFLKNSQVIQIDDETVDYIMKLVINIFENPEPFLEVIFKALAGNLKQLFAEANKQYVNSGGINYLTLYAPEHKAGIYILIEGEQFDTALDPKGKNREIIPADEILELLLQANEGYYEVNFRGIIQDLPTTAPTRMDEQPSPQAQVSPQEIPAKPQKSTATEPSRPTASQPVIKKKDYLPLILPKIILN